MRAPDKFPTLQSIVESEIAEGTNKGSQSCTLGLLWLKRYVDARGRLGGWGSSVCVCV